MGLKMMPCDNFVPVEVGDETVTTDTVTFL